MRLLCSAPRLEDTSHLVPLTQSLRLELRKGWPQGQGPGWEPAALPPQPRSHICSDLSCAESLQAPCHRSQCPQLMSPSTGKGLSPHLWHPEEGLRLPWCGSCTEVTGGTRARSWPQRPGRAEAAMCYSHVKDSPLVFKGICPRMPGWGDLGGWRQVL